MANENIKLNFAHICENAFITEGSKNLNIIGIFENINAIKFPAVHPKFSVVTVIQGNMGKYEQILTITNEKTKEEISRIAGQSNISVLNGKTIFIGTFVMTKFPLQGKYLVNIFIDNNKIGTVEFNVKTA